VERARRKLSGASIEIAAMFSGRGDGIDRFLTRLEGSR
jgi:hypothetical protein